MRGSLQQGRGWKGRGAVSAVRCSRAEDGKGADADCQFCLSRYAFSAEELREMADRVKALKKIDNNS